MEQKSHRPFGSSLLLLLTKKSYYTPTNRRITAKMSKKIEPVYTDNDTSKVRNVSIEQAARHLCDHIFHSDTKFDPTTTFLLECATQCEQQTREEFNRKKQALRAEVKQAKDALSLFFSCHHSHHWFLQSSRQDG